MMKLEDCKWPLAQVIAPRSIGHLVDMCAKGSMTYVSALSLTFPNPSWNLSNEYASKSKKHNGFTKILFARLIRVYLP